MYNDSNPEIGNCDVLKEYWTIKNNFQKGLFLSFTEDNYSEHSYLCLKVCNNNLMTTVSDDQHRDQLGMLFYRISESTINV
jgi:hypothetical protein